MMQRGYGFLDYYDKRIGDALIQSIGTVEHQGFLYEMHTTTDHATPPTLLPVSSAMPPWGDTSYHRLPSYLSMPAPPIAPSISTAPPVAPTQTLYPATVNPAPSMLVGPSMRDASCLYSQNPPPRSVQYTRDGHPSIGHAYSLESSSTLRAATYQHNVTVTDTSTRGVSSALLTRLRHFSGPASDRYDGGRYYADVSGPVQIGCDTEEGW